MMRRESGSMLLEVVIAISVITVGLLGFFSTFYSTVRASGELAEEDEVRVAIENLMETLRAENFSNLYANYNARWLQVPTLKWYGGGPAWAYVMFYVNEASLPSSFGPVTDIDGNPSSTSTDCSSNYKLLPTRILLYYLPQNAPTYKVYQLFATLGPTA